MKPPANRAGMADVASPRNPSDPLGASPAARAVSGERVPWLYFLAFLIGTALVVVAIWYTIDNERRGILTMWRSRVATVADDRVRFVESWLAARQGDAEVLATSPIVRARLKGEGAGEAALVKHLTQVTGTYGYASIWVFDARGQLVARSSWRPRARNGDRRSSRRRSGSQGPHRPDRRGARPANPQHLGARLRRGRGPPPRRHHPHHGTRGRALLAPLRGRRHDANR